MRPFIPPTLRSFELPATADPVDQHAPVRAEAYTDGYNAGLHDGHAAGMAEGQALVRASADAELARMRGLLDEQGARQAVAAALARLTGQRDSDLAAMAEAARTAMAEALQQVFPVFLRSAMGAEVATLVTEAAAARAPEQLTLRAAQATLDAVLAQDLPEAQRARITLVAVPDRPPGWAEIAWTGGGLTFDPDALLWQVSDILSPSQPVAKDAAND